MRMKMRFYVLMLATVFFLCVNSVVSAKTTLTKGKSTRTVSASAASFLKVDSTGTLKGGIEFKRYRGEKYIKRRCSYASDASSNFEYSIDWPVSGPTEVVSAIRRKIVKILKGDLSVKLPSPTATNLPQIVNQLVSTGITADKRNDSYLYIREYNIDLLSNGAAVTLNVSFADYEGPVNGFPYGGERFVYRISDGKEMSKYMLPSWEKIRPLVCDRFYNYDERQYSSFGGEGAGYNRNNLPEPGNLPIFNENEILYEYWPYEIASGAEGFFYGHVYYSDMYKYASDEMKTFLPDLDVINNIEEIKKKTKADTFERAILIDTDDLSINQKEEKKEEIVTDYDIAPEFPGGTSKLMIFLSNNMRYPESAAQNNIQGKVVVKFVVNEDGTIGDVEVPKSVDPDLDKEAIRVVKKMPNWIPGRKDGKPVKCYFNVPLTFRLSTPY